VRRLLPLFWVVLMSPLLGGQSWTEDQGEMGGEVDLLALGLDVEEQVGAPINAPLSGPALEARTEQISGVLRCPVCQGLSVADSPSESARNMKRQIRAMVAAGYTEAQITEYFVGAYGDFVLMSPEKRGFNLFVWLAPVGVLLVGGGLGLATIRKSALQRAPDASESTGQADEPSGLDPWIEKIRSEAAED